MDEDMTEGLCMFTACARVGLMNWERVIGDYSCAW